MTTPAINLTSYHLKVAPTNESMNKSKETAVEPSTVALLEW